MVKEADGGTGGLGDGGKDTEANAPSPRRPVPPSGTESLLAVQLGPLSLKNPIVTASGTFGYGLEFTDWVDLARLGGLCTKGLSLRPHAGNAPPRICETPAGMLNAIGLQNIGVDVFLSEKLPRLRSLGATVIANVWGDLEEDYVAIVKALEGAQGLAAVELNISCPNVKKGGMLFGNSPSATASLVSRVREATLFPLIVKLSPNAPDLIESARAARTAGADVLSLVNTFVGMAIDPETARPRLSFGTGGLSGPAIKPLAVRMVYQVARALPDTPLMGIGGISSLSDVLEFLAAGATAVQVGTANFVEPGVSQRLVEELEQYCRGRGVTAASLVGRAHRTGPAPAEAGAEG